MTARPSSTTACLLSQQRTFGLVGGVLYAKGGANGDRWSYPSIHGDVMATADANGAKVGATATYDPFGKSLTALPDNEAGNFDYGWLDQHQRPLEHEGSLATIEMGARPYVPSLGRFLEVDPVEGGSCNDYDYVCGDPGIGQPSLKTRLAGIRPILRSAEASNLIAAGLEVCHTASRVRPSPLRPRLGRRGAPE